MRSALVALAALAAALLALVLWRSLPRSHPPGTAVAPPPAGPVQTRAEAATLRSPTASGQPAREAAAAPDRADASAAGEASMPAARERARLDLEVVDADGAPVPDARLLVRSHTGPRPDLYALVDDRGVVRTLQADAQGGAHLDGLPTGPYEVLAAATAGAPRTAHRFALEAPRTQVRVRLDAPDGDTDEVLVRVVGAQGEPVAGAAVELTAGAGDLRGGRAEGTVTSQAVADERGLARFPDPGYLGLVLVAVAPDGRQGSTTIWTRANVVREAHRGGIEVRVEAPASLEGALTGLPPERLEGARVLARLLTNTFPHWTTHGRDFAAPVVDGRYAFEALAQGTYTLALADPGGARLVLPPFEGWSQVMPNSVDPIEVELQGGTRVRRDLEVTAGGVLEGLVRDEAGAALAGVIVRATFTPRSSNFPDGFYVRGVNVWRFDSRSGGDDDHPETHRRATSDDDGRYRLAGLHPGLHRVEVVLPGRLYDRREEVELRDGETTRLEHALVPAGAIQGVSRGSGYVGVLRAGEERARMIAILSRERVFCFPGLEPGSWTVAQFHSDARIEPVPLVRVEVTAGRTTWVDLDRQGEYPVRLAGRVLERGAPLEGVAVTAWPRRLGTDALGRFELRVAFPWTDQVSFTVERGGVETRFGFPGMAPGSLHWEGDLELGEHALVVHAEDADGRPAAATLELELSESARPEIDRVRASGLALGAPALRALPAGSYAVLATFPDGARVGAQVELPRSEPLALRAPPAGTLEVLVRHPDGRPAAGASVLTFTWTGEGPAPTEDALLRESAQARSATTGADGRALLEGVPAGELLVRAEEQRSGWVVEPGPQASERVELARSVRLALELTLERP